MIYFKTRELARTFARQSGRSAPTKTNRGWGVKVL